MEDVEELLVEGHGKGKERVSPFALEDLEGLLA